MKQWILIILNIFTICILLPYNGYSDTYADYYQSPVKHKVRLSGTFCELRSNHFHAGIDIRSSRGVAGDSIFSVADGNLSRVRVQRSSYGQVLYIDHDNGTTSVYAHLEEFHPKIESLVKKYQYTFQSSEIDLYLDSLDVQIDKGDYIGKMGNTGRSFGPHLHFEIRDTPTEEPLNPFNYGFDVDDRADPVILSVWVYTLDQLGRIVDKILVPTQEDKDGTLVGKLDHCQSPKIGIGVGTFDRVDAYKSYKGIYGATVAVQDDTLCTYVNDRFNWDDFRGINGLIDYGHYKSTGSRITKFFQMQNQNLSLFQDCDDSRGIITLDSLDRTKVEVSIFDYNQNIRTIRLDLPACDEQVTLENRKITNGKSYVNGNLSIDISPNTFYEDCDIKVEQVGSSYQIGRSSIPLHRPIHVSIKDPSLDPRAILVKKGTDKSFGGQVIDGELTTTILELGTFVISKDSTPPSIGTIRFSENKSKYSSWKFEIQDNYSDKIIDKKLQVYAHIDGNFIRSIYDSKSNSLTISDLDRIPDNASILRITAVDIHGNIKNRDYQL